MIKTELNGKWRMSGAGFECEGTVPGSVYSFLLENKLVDDPFYRENELEALKILENEFQTYMIYLNSFNGKKGIFRYDKYNKDLEYDKIVLKTLDYIIKSEKLNKLLSEQEKIKKQLEEQEQLKKQLEEDQKKIKNTKQQLKKFDFEQEL